MSALFPVVNRLTLLKIPKALAILLVYVLIFGLVGTVITLSFTPLIEQTVTLSTTLPEIFSNLLKISNVDQSVIQRELGNLSGNLFTVTKSIFDHLITIIFLLVLTFYLLLERQGLEKRVSTLFVGQELRVKKLIVEVEEKLGAWFRGQLILSVMISVLCYLGLTILQIPYALPLAIVAGFLEVVPVIGPIISAIPAILLGLTISPVLAAGVAAMYFIIQQMESHVIVPQIMNKAVGLNPLVVILAIAVGGRLLGIGGALLAVPITVVIQVIVTDVLKGGKE